ncbi:MAG: glycosyltransferase family 2 protein [Chloroflexota bacterium]
MTTQYPVEQQVALSGRGGPLVSIVVANWNGLDDTRECLRSLQGSTYANYATVVVDNHSDGDDAAILRQDFGSYTDVVETDRNYGCGEGFNIGIRHALATRSPDYVMVLNNDVVVAPDMLECLVRVMRTDEGIGMVGPKIYYYDYHGRKDIIWSAGGALRYWAPRIQYQRGEDREDGPEFSFQRQVDWLSGAVLLIRASLLRRTGLFNPWYFFGPEDIELCLQARKHGARLVYVPAAKAWHKVGVTAAKLNLLHADPAAYYYLVRKCFPWYVYVYQRLMFPALLAHWALRYILRHRDKPLRPFLSELGKSLVGRARRHPMQ